ncbi:MAG: HU family DNA-binding protein [Bdellovibrionota bacterium]
MNRAEIVEALANKTGKSKADSEKWLSAFIQTVTKSMQNNNEVKLVGFGTFATAKRKPRVGRNPQTGETVHIPARTVPVFRPGSDLKEVILNSNKSN